jgi:perosamine synthetase
MSVDAASPAPPARDQGQEEAGPRRALALFGAAPVMARGAHRRWPIVGEEERAALARVLDRGILSGPFAPESRALEEEFAAFVGAKHCLLTHCGTSALLIGLAGAGVRAGDEVVVPAYSFVATPLAVVQAGAVPVFADVDAATGCLDPAAFEAAITPRTRAVMPVHMHGCAADLLEIGAVARRRGLAIVEDAAQAHGATLGGRPVGAIGAAGGFSLQSSKNLGAGEGGLFVTNDEAVAREAAAVRNFGQDLSSADEADFDLDRPLDGTRGLDARRVGSMYRGNEMMAAFARAQLRKLPERTARCQANADRLSRALGDLPGVTPPFVPPGRTSVHHKYRVQLDPARAGLGLSPQALRGAMARALRAEGLEVVLWQSAPLPSQGVFHPRDPAEPLSRSLEGGTDLAKNYDPARYPRTQALLDGSIVLFSQSCPLIAQGDDVVDRYIEAFRRVWHHREALADWATRHTS